MKAEIILLIALILAITLAGCLSSQQNLACESLTAVPATSIPKCASIEECSKKVSESFKIEKFGESMLDEELAKWGNSTALNWHYYNKAKNALKEAQEICLSKEQAELPKKLNETAFYLTQSFQAIDSANKNAFAAISLQEARLRSEKIEEIREESLFDDFTELNEILNQNPEAKSNFLKRHFEASAELKKLMQETGFKQEFEAEISERDLLDEALPEVFKKIRPTNIMAVLAEKAAKGISEYLNNQEKLSESIKRMNAISAAKTAKAIENFTGLENSTASEFSSLMNRQKGHEKNLEEENNERIDGIEKSLKAAMEKIETMQASEFIELDQEFLEELMRELGITASIELKKKEFQSLAEFQQNSFKKQQELEIWLAEEKRKKQTIGEKTGGLKELEKQALRLEKELETAWQEMIEKTSESCNAKAQIMQENTSQLEKLQGIEKGQLILLKAKIQKTLQEKGKEQLLECKKMLQAFNDLKEKTTNKALLENNSKTEKECIQFLESNIQNHPNIRERLETIKAFEEEKSLEACERLKDEMLMEAMEKTKNLAEKWQELSMKKSTLEAIAKDEKEIKAVEKKASELKEYLEGSNWFLKAEGLKEELEKNIQSLIQEIDEKTTEIAVKQMEENAIIEISGNNEIEANALQKTTIKITLESQVSIAEQATVKLPFDFENAKLSKSSVPAEIKQDRNSIEIRLERIEKGKASIEFEATGVAAETEESMKSILTTKEKALFEKKIKVKTKEKTKIKKLLIKTSIPENSENARAESEWKSVEATTIQGITEITLYNAENNQEISLVFEVKNPITAETNLIEETKNSNGKTIKAEISVKNRLGLRLENLKIELNAFEKAEEISAIDERVSEKKAEKTMEKWFLLEEALTGFEEKKYEITASFGETSFEWREIIKESLQKAGLLKLSQNTEIAEQAGKLEEQLAFWNENFSEKNTDHKKTVLGIAGKIKELENSEKSTEQEKALFEQEAIETEEKIQNAKNTAQNSPKAGLKLREAEESLKNAKSEKAANLKNAMQELQKARAKLKEATDEIEKEITSEKKEKTQKFLDGIEKFEKIGIETNNEKQEILALGEKAGQEIRQGNIQEAKKTLKEISEKSEKNTAAVMEKAGEKITLFLENYGKLEAKKQALQNLLKKTEKTIDGASEKDLADIQYLSPINRQGLARIKLEINGLNLEELKESSENVRKLKDQNKLAEALEIIEKNKKQAEEESAKIEEITQTLKESLEEMQNDAKTEIEKAKDSIAETNTQDKKAALLIEKAENEIGKENFLKAIQYANYASALVSLKQEFTIPELPLSIIPLITIAGIALALKKKKEKEEKNKQERIQRILRKSQD